MGAEELLGPLAALLALPTLIMAVVVYVATQGIKTAIDIKMGGTAKRKLNPYLSRVVLPTVPLVLGFLYGAFVPFRPAAITEYVSGHPGSSMVLVGGMFGVVVGQFADYIYGKITKGMQGFAEHKRRSITPPAPEPEGDNGAN